MSNSFKAGLPNFRFKLNRIWLILLIGLFLSSLVYGQKQILDGIQREYDENGKLVMESSYKNGVPDGFTRIYYPNGKLAGEWEYKEHIPVGVAKEYGEDGRLIRVTDYRNKKDGIAVITGYYPDGKVQYEETFKHNRLINRKYFDQNGKLVFDTDY